MKMSCEEYQILITGYIDGELGEEELRRLEEHVEGCSACERELGHVQRLAVGTAASCVIHEPPEEVWDTFLDDVYNRAERKTGWVLVILGTIALTAFGLTLFIQADDISLLTKLLLSVPVIGLVVLFISVLRQRMSVASTDRYSKEVYK